MMKNLNLVILVVALMLNSCATAQYGGYTTKNKSAIKLYEKGKAAPQQNIDLRTGQPDFYAGIELLKKALAKDPNFLEAHQMIGEFYILTENSKEAVFHFKTALQIRPSDNLNGRMYLDIGILQIKNKEFKDAIDYFDMIINSRSRTISNELIAAAQYSKEVAVFNIEARKNPLDIHPLNIGTGINTKYPEYFPTLTVDGKTMLFTREIGGDRSKGRKGQEDFFVSTLSEDNVWTKAIPMPPNINTSRNEGAPTISADGRTLIFVACVDEAGSFGPNRQGKGSCDLFITKRIGNAWTDPVNLPGGVNTATWESQPSLSADGQTLYFVRRVGGPGTNNSDIFVSKRQDDGIWGKAIPLPGNINTPGMETSVLIHPDGQTLYFTSDGHPGLGGTDIFMSRKDPLGNWGDPKNLGYPINTENNENSLLVDPNGDIAFFASDRPGGQGDLDIYYFEMPEQLRPVKTTFFKGIVYDAITKKPLNGKFVLIDLSTGEQVVESEADPITGEFMLALPTKREYALHANYPGYSFFSKNFNLLEGDGEGIQMDVPMLPLTDEEPVRLANVFFDLNKATLRKESYVELNKLTDFLNENNKVKIEIGGHTDSRGSDVLNQKLSEDRAKAVYDYLISKGIDSGRLTYKGYGKSKPIITDEEIAELETEKEKEAAYQENRRTEYRIIK